MILNIVSLSVVKLYPSKSLLFISRTKITGAITTPIVVRVHNTVHDFEHSIPKSPIPIWSPTIAAAVNPGIKSPAIQNFNVGVIKLYFFFVVIS